MRLTILFDLDDTLLGNDIDKFLPAYLHRLSKTLNSLPEEKMSHELLIATEGMVRKKTPKDTLQKTFDDAFYPGIGIPKQNLQDTLDLFYQNEFPKLQPLTERRPEAVQLVHELIDRGHSLVVATNPVFPSVAIHHRLNWAGFSTEQNPFDLVTSYEKFHFCKPNPAFYSEVLSQLGCPERPAVMVGNSLNEDIIPAAKAGLPTFWLTRDEQALPDGLMPNSQKGWFEQILPWIEQMSAECWEPKLTTPSAQIATLNATPAAFDTLVASISPEQFTHRPSDGEWSLTEILCHMRDTDREVHLPRIKTVTQEENPFLPGVSTDHWAEIRQYNQQDGLKALQEFLQCRIELIQVLTKISAEQWKLPARHAIFGPTTLNELVGIIVTHDQNHVRQLRETIKILSNL